VPTYADSVDEVVTATDADSALLVSPQMVEEFGIAVAVQSAIGTFGLSVVEGVTALSVQSAGALFLASVAETADAEDAQIAAKVAPAVSLSLRGRIYDEGPAVDGLISDDAVSVTGAIT
jgi:hypothetical protein